MPTRDKKMSPYSRQRLVANGATHGQGFWQRPHARLGMCNAETGQELSAALLVQGVSGIQDEGTFRSKWAANLCGDRGKPC
jgi:hypothetical protein